jgi:hypothetical protein
VGKRVSVGGLRTFDEQGAPVVLEVGVAEKHELVAHTVRQALQSLGVEIDADDCFDSGAVTMAELRKAYDRFAGPQRLREER